MERPFRLKSHDEARSLFGRHDDHLKLLEKEFDVKLFSRGEDLVVSGEEQQVMKVGHLIEEFLTVIRSGGVLKMHEVLYAVRATKDNREVDPSKIYLDRIEVSSKRQFVTPKTAGQKLYVDAIRNYDIVFGIGPAGTGKTYLAMAMAVQALQRQEVSRIILTRPAVEAGERLGFLPGDLYEKVTPYLRPLYDALYDMMEVDQIERYIERGIIEVAPLAFMRGRTLNDSFIILDEAQNSTQEQMKMFLTRLGFDSKTVITGDVTQVDLPSEKRSGLVQVQELLKDIKGIQFIYFTGQDVVRHELVQQIIKAYEKIGEEE
ncbi:MAG: PhoH family protein [Candidatus Omnitrophica bacterium]|nr:PhoH family protein [Candidatus Omnitrophota bacterium]